MWERKHETRNSAWPHLEGGGGGCGAGEPKHVRRPGGPASTPQLCVLTPLVHSGRETGGVAGLSG
jgi:hypothetical protein